MNKYKKKGSHSSLIFASMAGMASLSFSHWSKLRLMPKRKREIQDNFLHLKEK